MELLQKNQMTPSQLGREKRNGMIVTRFSELLNKGYSKTAARYKIMQELGYSYSHIVKLTK